MKLIIIGGGSAGYAAARTAASLGLSVTVVDGAEELGGLCILRGCMPSKTLLATAKVADRIRHAGDFGIEVGEFVAKPAEILARKRRLIGEFASYRAGQLTEGKFALVRGHARFLSPRKIEVHLRDGGTQQLDADAFILATGSVITEPPIPGLKDAGYWTTDDALEADRIPESFTILGGGAIAVEFATYYHALGSRVSVIQRSPQLITGADADVADALQRAMGRRGMQFFTGTRLVDARRDGAEKTVRFEQHGKPCEISSREILCALGRRPAIAGLDLERAGIRIEKERPAMRDTQQTSTDHIFAAGDIAGPYEVVHIAIQQGEIAARNAACLLRGDTAPMETVDYRLRMSAIFSDPEVATVGASELDLQKAGTPHRAARYDFSDHGKAMCIGETDGFVKLLAHAETKEILGGACVGPHASELIHEIAVAMRFRATAGDLAGIPHYHPTLSEIWTYPAEELAG